MTGLLSPDRTFGLSLHTRWRALLFLLVLGAAGWLTGRLAIRTAWASRLSRSLVVSDLMLALALDPANPVVYSRLALATSLLPEESASGEPLQYLRQAVRLSPHSTLHWLNLISACEAAGDMACGDEAVGRALSLSPMLPQVHWAAANYYLRTDRPQQAWAEFRRLLGMTRQYDQPALQACFRSYRDPQLIVREVLPDDKDPTLKLALINMLSREGEIDSACQVWTLTMSDSAPPTVPSVRPFLEVLIQAGRFAEAWSVWQDLVRMEVIRPSSSVPANLVFNGDFEQVPLNGGFDWTFRREPYLEVDSRDPSAPDGGRCLHLDFTVSRNADYEPVYQFVPVAPQQAYTLSALVRAEGITSDSGPRLRALDADCPRCLDVATESVVGTKDWAPVSVTFTTGSETRFLRLSVRRPRGRTFPMDISGRFWLDKVSLVPTDIPTAAASPAALPGAPP